MYPINSNTCPKYVQVCWLLYHLYQGLSKYSLWVESGQLPGFVKFYWHTAMPTHLRMLVAASEVQGQSWVIGTDYLAHKVQNIHYLALYRGGQLTRFMLINTKSPK